MHLCGPSLSVCKGPSLAVPAPQQGRRRPHSWTLHSLPGQAPKSATWILGESEALPSVKSKPRQTEGPKGCRALTRCMGDTPDSLKAWQRELGEAKGHPSSNREEAYGSCYLGRWQAQNRNTQGSRSQITQEELSSGRNEVQGQGEGGNECMCPLDHLPPLAWVLTRAPACSLCDTSCLCASSSLSVQWEIIE